MATIEPVEIELLTRNAELPDPELVLARFAEHYAESVERARDLAARADLADDALFESDGGDEELLDITALAAAGEGGDDVGAFFAAQAGDVDALTPEDAPEELELADLDAQADLGDAAAELDAMLAAAEEMPSLGELGEGVETEGHEGAELQGAPEATEVAPPALSPTLPDEAWGENPDASADERTGQELSPEDEWSADQWAVEPREEASGEAGAQTPSGGADEGVEWSGDQWAAAPSPDDGPVDDQEVGVGFDAPEAAEATPPVAGADEDDDDAGFGAQGPLEGEEDQGVGFDAPEAAEATPPVAGADEDDDDAGFGAQGPLERNESAQEDGQAGEWSADLWDVAPEDEDR